MISLPNFAGAALRQKWLASNRHAFSDVGAHRRPRLLVDVSVIARHDAGTGIQRVVRSVFSELMRMDSREFDVVPVYAGRTHGYCFVQQHIPPGARMSKVPVGVRPGDKFLGLDLAASLLPYYAEQLAAWRANGASLHFVVYDLLPLEQPGWFGSATASHFARWFQALMEHADQALCISDTVAQDLRRKLIAAGSRRRPAVGRLSLTGHIAASVPSYGLSRQVKDVLEKVRSRPTILMVGTIEPRKGYDLALDAFEQVWMSSPASAPDLVIVGKRGWKTSSLQDRIRRHSEYGRRLHWLENVSDEALTGFYEACRAVFLASHNEGFGLPAVEAATHRRWVLVRDLPVFREQRLPNVRFFKDDSASSLAGQLVDLLQTASAGPPAAANLPRWSWCVQRMIEEIGLSTEKAPRRTPVMPAIF